VCRQQADAESGDDEVLHQVGAVSAVRDRGSNPVIPAIARMTMSSALLREFTIQLLSWQAAKISPEVPTGR